MYKRSSILLFTGLLLNWPILEIASQQPLTYDELARTNKLLTEQKRILEIKLHNCERGINNPPGNSVSTNNIDKKIEQEKARIADILNHQKPSALAQEIQLFGNTFQTYIVDTQSPDILMDAYYKDESGKEYRELEILQKQVEGKNNDLQLVFATNGGMFNQQLAPNGLLISGGKKITPLNEKKGLPGNFYIQPNGIFFLDKDGKPKIYETDEISGIPNLLANVKMATQSGPLLVHGGQINNNLRKGSRNLNIRSGVGIIDDRYIIFAISKRPVNFYNFASLFKEIYNCQNALFLDGAVSRVLCPEKGWKNNNGRLANFATIIGVFKKIK